MDGMLLDDHVERIRATSTENPDRITFGVVGGGKIALRIRSVVALVQEPRPDPRSSERPAPAGELHGV
jgi:hypothetical protein